MLSRARNANDFATSVALALVTKHRFPKQAAIGAVQSEEKFVRSQFTNGVAPAFTAKRLAEKAKRFESRPIPGQTRGDLGFAAHESLKAKKGRALDPRVPGMAAGADSCGLDPDWQPPFFGEDLSGSALEALDTSILPPLDAIQAFKRATTSLPLIHQYFQNQKDQAGKRISRLRMPGALYVEKTGNTKVIGGPNYKARRKEDHRLAAATYASISSSCPDECSLRDNGCYAQQGKTSMTIKRLDAEAKRYNLTSIETAASEAYSILTSYNGGPVKGKTDLRVHVGGDSQTVAGTHLIASAVADWQRRGGVQAWSYTHAWRKVPRKAWGIVSTLASIDDPRTECADAKAQGYAPAIVVQSFGPLHSVKKVGKGTFVVEDYAAFKREMEERRAIRPFKGDPTETLYIPCPAQVGEFSLSKEEFDSGIKDPTKGKRAGIGCLDCRWCFNEDKLRAQNKGIMFEAHGPKTKRALEVLGARRAPHDVEDYE